MASQNYRLKKGQSVLLSLYSISAIPLFFYFLFIYLIVLTAFRHFSFTILNWPFLLLILKTLQMITLSMLISVPIAVAICYYFLVYKIDQFMSLLKIILHQLNDLPVLLYGIVPLYFFKNSELVFYIIYILIIVPRLANRWLNVSKQVRDVEIESVQAIGFDTIQIFKMLYFDRFYKVYLLHILSLSFLLFFLVTPFLWYQNIGFKPLSLQFFSFLGEGDQNISVLLLTLLCVFSLKSWVDSKLNNFGIDHV